MKKVRPIDGELNFNYLHDEKNGLSPTPPHKQLTYLLCLCSLNIHLEIDISLIWRTHMNSKLNGLRVSFALWGGVKQAFLFVGVSNFLVRVDSHIVVCNGKPNIEMFPMKSNSEWTKFEWNKSRKLLTLFLHSCFASRMLHFQVCSLASLWSLRFRHLLDNAVFWVLGFEWRVFVSNYFINAINRSV